jgi:hypothetical protein
MSSGPVGLDVREYAYGHFSQVINAPGFWEISARKNWLVTKVQFYAGANGGQLALDPNPAIVVAANGCLILEPNGAFRSKIEALGVDSLLIVEFWFQALAGQFVQSIPIDVVVPP